MADKKPKVLLLFDQRVRERYISPDELERLESFANWNWFETGFIAFTSCCGELESDQSILTIDVNLV